jgi:hypothetical protein
MPKQRGKLSKARTLEKLIKEVGILQRVQDCPNVVRLLGTYEGKDEVMVVTELCEGGDLQKLSDVSVGRRAGRQTAACLGTGSSSSSLRLSTQQRACCSRHAAGRTTLYSQLSTASSGSRRHCSRDATAAGAAACCCHPQNTWQSNSTLHGVVASLAAAAIAEQQGLPPRTMLHPWP